MEKFTDFAEAINYLVSKGEVPKTDFTRTIEVNVYDAKVFIGRIKEHIEILVVVNKTYEVTIWETLLSHAQKLLNVNEK